MTQLTLTGLVVEPALASKAKAKQPDLPGVNVATVYKNRAAAEKITATFIGVRFEIEERAGGSCLIKLFGETGETYL